MGPLRRPRDFRPQRELAKVTEEGHATGSREAPGSSLHLGYCRFGCQNKQPPQHGLSGFHPLGGPGRERLAGSRPQLVPNSLVQERIQRRSVVRAEYSSALSASSIRWVAAGASAEPSVISFAVSLAPNRATICKPPSEFDAAPGPRFPNTADMRHAGCRVANRYRRRRPEQHGGLGVAALRIQPARAFSPLRRRKKDIRRHSGHLLPRRPARRGSGAQPSTESDKRSPLVETPGTVPRRPAGSPYASQPA